MNKKYSLILMLLIVFSLVFTACAKSDEEKNHKASQKSKEEAVEIYVSAAASLTDALTDLQKIYATKNNVGIVFNFGGSGALQKQIEEGAPCDLFLSASQDNMDALETKNLIVKNTRKDILGNQLTLIAAKEKKHAIKDVSSLTNQDIQSISIGTPESVPAGKYALEVFEKLEIWDKIEQKLVYAKDVRQVLEYVDSGNVDCGLVYKSDALLLNSGTIIYNLPEDSHSKIVYPGAILKNATEPEATQAFYEFLQSKTAKEVFEKYGFTVY